MARKMVSRLQLSLLVLAILPVAADAGSCDAHFTFDGDLQDTGGNGYNGQMIGKEGTSATPQFADGKYGKALQLDGASAMRSFIDLHFDTCPQVTVSAWIQVAGMGRKGVQYLFSTGSGSGPGIRVSGTNLTLSGSANGIIQRNAIRANAGWMFVAGVYDYEKGTYTLFSRNRGVDKEMGASRKAPEDAIWVGAFNDGLAGPATDILIDDLRIQGRALSANEIQILRKTAPTSGESEAASGQGLTPDFPAPIPGMSDRLPTTTPTIDPDALPDSPTDIIDAMKGPLSRAQLIFNQAGAIAHVSVGTHVFSPWGTMALNSQLQTWATEGKRITEITNVPGQDEAVAIAEFADYLALPDEPQVQQGVARRLMRLASDGKSIDLVALPPSATTQRSFFIVAGGKVYSSGISPVAVTIAENALAAGEEVSAAIFPTNDSFAIATSGGIYTANLPSHSTLASDLLQLHQAGERIEDIAIHPKGFGWTGETGSYAIVTDRRIKGVHVRCNSFDTVRDWAQQNGVPRQVSCDDGGDGQVADELPPQEIPDLSLKDNQCEWGVRGTLAVHHGLEVLQEQLGKSWLAGVKVRVSGATPLLNGWGTWNAWPPVTTDAYGRFAVRQAKGCGRRRIKLEIKFQDDDLEIRHRTSTNSLTKVKWQELDRYAGEGGLIIVDDFEIGRPAGTPGVLAKEPAGALAHADIWVLYKKIISLMKARGSVFEFKKQVKIKYPHDGVAPDERESSYANPENGVIYITDKGSFENFTADTLVHELGHIWSYQHSADSYNISIPIMGVKRPSCLTLGFLRGVKFQTHGLVADRCVAFYEGFAEFFKDHVLFSMFKNSYQKCGNECPQKRPVPFSRAYLGFGPWTGGAREPIINIELLQRHDMGWYSALHALTDTMRGRHVLGAPYSGSGTPTRFAAYSRSTGCSGGIGPVVSFWDVLRSFSPGSGYPFFRPIRLADERVNPALQQFNDTRLDNFLQRLGAVTGKLNATEITSMRRLIDPAESIEAWDVFCP